MDLERPMPDGKTNSGRADHFRQRRSGDCDFVSLRKDGQRESVARQAEAKSWCDELAKFSG
jgi:hypothetical protein